MDSSLVIKPQSKTADLRERISMDGPWEFCFEDQADWRTAMVPNPWQAEFADLRRASGVAIYSREFVIPNAWLSSEIIVRFGAVSYFAEVSINGHPVGTHEGGYLPFEFIIPIKHLTQKNRIEVKVTLPDGDSRRFPDFPFSEIPHGKQSWYGPLGGIWQSVYLESRSPHAILNGRIVATLHTGQVAVNVVFSSAPLSALLVAEIIDRDGQIVASTESIVSKVTCRLTMIVNDVMPWSPDNPNLYQVNLLLKVENTTVDAMSETFGFRTFQTLDGHFHLNGQAFYLRGALDQDYYPQGICTPPSVEFLEDQFRKAKALGINMLRCHIKVPDPRYYEVADRLGMLIWTEIPNVETFTKKSAQRLRETMEGILTRDSNHPSIVIWTLINEDWGIRLRESANHRQWLVDTFDWLKQADPTRLVVDNSPCAPNYHIKSDIDDYHYYRSIPERRGEWDQITREFSNGAEWSFSPYGETIRSGDEPKVNSEFGVWGLANPKFLRDKDGCDPWWFEGGELWSDGAGSLAGVENRFSNLYLDSVFGSFDAFVMAAQWYQFANLKYEIETMRAYPSIAGYVVTQLTDVHWEANGLMDMARNLRPFHQQFADINTDIVILPQLSRWAFWAGEQLDLNVKIATGGKILKEGAWLEWTVDGIKDQSKITATASFSVGDQCNVAIAIPMFKEPKMLDISFRLYSDEGSEIARNQVSVAVHPKANRFNIKVASDIPELRKWVTAMGYEVTSEKSADVLITRNLDAVRVEAIDKGQKVLLLAESGEGSLRSDPPPREPPHELIFDSVPGIPSQPYFSFPGYYLHDRNNTVWRGDWIANFSWLNRNGIFSNLPGGPLLDLTFENIIPRYVISGFRPWEFNGRIHAGIVAGWVHKPAATIIEKNLGAGKLTATTFRLTEGEPCHDPTASVLLSSLLQLASG